MSYGEANLDTTRLLAAVIENLNRFFFEESRDNAKRHFQALQGGKNSPFMRIDAGDSGEIYLELSLDHSEFVGNLSFSKFRKNLAMMMLGIRNKVEAEETISHMTNEQGDMLFNIPGIVKGKDATNVMVSALKQMQPGLINFQLMYLDPVRYEQAAQQTEKG